MRPSWASWSTTTATKVFVTLPTPQATSGSTGPLAGSSVGVPAVASVTGPSRSRRAMRAPTNSPASWWDCRIPSSIASRAGLGGEVIGGTVVAGAAVVTGAAVVVGAAALVAGATVVVGAVAPLPDEEHAVAASSR